MIFSVEKLKARATALEEAAEHLDMSWTNDFEERKQGKIVAKMLKREAEKFWRRAENQAKRISP